MKAMEAGAPMITVPAGVLKEFMAPTDTPSLSPAPPTTAASVLSTMTNKALTTTVSSDSKCVSAVLPTFNSTSITIVPANTRIVSQFPENVVNGQALNNDTENNLSDTNGDTESSQNSDGNENVIYNIISTRSDDEDSKGNSSNLPDLSVNNPSAGVKRASDGNESHKPDLKKIRVFAPSADDGFKKDVSTTVQEFNQQLDKHSKIFEEAENQESRDYGTLGELKNCYNQPPMGPGLFNSGISIKDNLAPQVSSSSLTSTNFNTSVTSATTFVTLLTSNNNQSSSSSSTSLASVFANSNLSASFSNATFSGVTLTKATAPPSVRKDEKVEAVASPPSQVGTPVLPKQDAVPSLEVKGPLEDKDFKQMQRIVTKSTRKELERLFMKLFAEKALYQCAVGQSKMLREKLEATLEANRKKTAQFHKEIEDLRKVTNRLAAEHASRKGQYVAPIRIKRSVGIQAAPHIISKGILHATNTNSNNSGSNTSGTNTIKTIVPRASSQPVASGTAVPSSGAVVPAGTLGIVTNSQASLVRPAGMGMAVATSVLGGVRAPAGQFMMMTAAGTMQTIARPPTSGVNTATAVLPVSQGRLVRAPLGNLPSVLPAPGSLLSTQRGMVQGDKAASPATAAAAPARGGVIDLTDEDEGAKGRAVGMVPKPGTLVKVPTSGTAQLLPLQAGGVGQVVLLPSATGGQPTTALLVSQVSSGVAPVDNNPAVAQARIGSFGSQTVVTATRVVGSVVNSVPRTTTTTTTMHTQSSQLRHPAPLPRTPIQQMGGLSKKLPPQPTLKLSHKDSSIVLSWTMSKTEDHEAIASYQLYAYQEGAAAPSATLWKKVGSVKALELPMACTLTQFMPGHVYHFAVRAVDAKSRLGPFSEPRSIRLDKK